MTQVVKNLLADAGDVRDIGLIPGLGNPVEEGMATHSSILASRIPWTEEPGGLQSIGPQRFGHECSDLAGTHACTWFITVKWVKCNASNVMQRQLWVYRRTSPLTFVID